ncbi:Uncharacterized protein APZ42_007996, partial [Daphnia magna]
LEQHGLLDIIDGVEIKPTEVSDEDGIVKNADAISRWKLKDVTARNYIFATTDDELRDTLCTSTTAADMYARIRNQHSRNAADNRLILLQQFTEYKYKQGHNMTSHVTALELLWSKLTDVGEQIMETQVISKILSTLPPSYRHFYTTWNNSPEEGRTVKLLLAKLQEEQAISQAFNKKEDDNVLSQSGAYTNFQDYNQLSQSRGFTGAHFPYLQARYQPYFSARGTRRGGYPGLRGGTRGFRGMYRGRGGTSSQQL